jgi:erythromycin esterase-like protein
MMQTIERLLGFHGERSKIIVWAHNTHIGDARATDMADENMINVGQLLHEKYDNEGVISLGFGSYEGAVLAGTHWGSKVYNVNMPMAKKNSWEFLLNESIRNEKVYLPLHKLKEKKVLNQAFGHRAVGVVYNPENEKYGNYVPSIIPMRYDAFVFFKNTKALHTIDVKTDIHQIPETYPFGF